MTRATSKPVVRVVRAGSGPYPEMELVVEVRDRELRLRPIRTKRGGPQEICVTWSTIQLHAIAALVESQHRDKKRKRRAR